jgi:heme/copper-type cytochrome/quinol oxidase subunit 3
MSVLPPDLTWGTLNTVILIASVVPNEYTRHAAMAHDLRRSRIGLVWCIVFAAAFIAVRFVEFGALNVKWNTNAYGSAVWTLLGLHTTHLVTDFLDTVVLAVLLFTGPFESRRFVDVEENAVYYNFVVAAWLPIYAVLYWAPRL